MFQNSHLCHVKGNFSTCLEHHRISYGFYMSVTYWEYVILKQYKCMFNNLINHSFLLLLKTQVDCTVQKFEMVILILLPYFCENWFVAGDRKNLPVQDRWTNELFTHCCELCIRPFIQTSCCFVFSRIPKEGTLATHWKWAMLPCFQKCRLCPSITEQSTVHQNLSQPLLWCVALPTGRLAFDYVTF